MHTCQVSMAKTMRFPDTCLWASIGSSDSLGMEHLLHHAYICSHGEAYHMQQDRFELQPGLLGLCMRCPVASWLVHQVSTRLSLIASQSSFRCCLLAKHLSKSHNLIHNSSIDFENLFRGCAVF